MRLTISLITLVFCLSAYQVAYSQYAGAKDGFALRALGTNYQYLIDKEAIRSDFGLGLEFEYLRHITDGLNFSFPLRFAQVKVPLDEMGTLKESGIIGLDALIHLKYCKEPVFIYPHIFGGIGGVLKDLEEVSVEIPLGVGLNFRLARHLYLSTKGEYRLAFGDNRNYLQFGAGILFLVGPPLPPPVVDRDGDKVNDDVDLCPDIPGLAAFNGCPDSDGDGITDADDQCPTVAGLAVFSGCPDTDGDGITDADDQCPEEPGTVANNGCPVRDADGDGIPDNTDECPNEAGSPVTNGCPDRDADGVADRVDRCPDQVGLAVNQGCPDSDGDGVLDPDDRCPTTAGPASNNGWTEIQVEDRVTLTEAMSAVQFETARATLKAGSPAVLDRIVDILRRYPDYKLRINGHTDSVGSSGSNQALSENRARTCYEYFISRGISAGRLSYQGFGETQPIADNNTSAGRAQNRRVHFDLYLD